MSSEEPNDPPNCSCPTVPETPGLKLVPAPENRIKWQPPDQSGNPNRFSKKITAEILESRSLPAKEEREMKIISETMAEGVLKYGMPGCILAAAGTFLLRRRHHQIKSTPVEAFALSALHYYAAVSVGLFTGMKIFEPTFEQRIIDRMPDSNMAHAIKEKRRSI